MKLASLATAQRSKQSCPSQRRSATFRRLAAEGAGLWRDVVEAFCGEFQVGALGRELAGHRSSHQGPCPVCRAMVSRKVRQPVARTIGTSCFSFPPSSATIRRCIEGTQAIKERLGQYFVSQQRFQGGLSTAGPPKCLPIIDGVPDSLSFRAEIVGRNADNKSRPAMVI
jgi:hypothetical protein